MLTTRKTYGKHVIAFIIGLQVFNISINQNDALLGKNGDVFNVVNEIETFTEFVAEVCLTDQDVFPESQVPGGTLGFEEEEVHFFERQFTFVNSSKVLSSVHSVITTYLEIDFKDHIKEIKTPPPQA